MNTISVFYSNGNEVYAEKKVNNKERSAAYTDNTIELTYASKEKSC